MTRGRIILVGGGARSGKSAFALAYARKLGPRRAFLATAEALDGEMTARIARHQDERGDSFRTLEEPVAIAETIERLGDIDVLVLDCVTLWLSNLLLRGESHERIAERIAELGGVMARATFHSILVTNEVGMGLVPETPLGREFRDLAGLAHQQLARVAHEVYVAILGSILRIRPGPVAAQLEGANDVEPA